MKITATFIISFLTFVSFSQNFAPTGALWYYGEGHNGGNSYVKIESVKDSLFNGKNCNLLVKNTEISCEGRPLEVLVYEEDSVVYFWDVDFEEFQILYDLKKNIGEFWSFKIKSYIDNDVDTLQITVNSVSFENINGNTLKRINVIHYKNAQNVYSAAITEKIGDFNFLFNYVSDFDGACDVSYSTGLRCYSDPIFGFYTTNTNI